ncbi:hypothetical protein V3C99_006352 [Haemonchus contortus]
MNLVAEDNRIRFGSRQRKQGSPPMNRARLVGIFFAVLLLQVAAQSCVFTELTGDHAKVKSLSSFFTAPTIDNCMWHCYNNEKCVLVRYREQTKACLLMQASDTDKLFPMKTNRVSNNTVQFYWINRQKQTKNPNCQKKRLYAE